MKNLLLPGVALCLMLTTKTTHAQFTDSMEVNTLKIKMFADGGLGEVHVLDNGTYKPLLYAQNLWIGGRDANGMLHTSTQTYRQSPTLIGFRAGPISNDPNVSTVYNDVYHVKLQTISDFVNGNTSGIPPEIANWPAHGNTMMGEAADLAPFVDVDNDGNYNPANGDYPDIKGDEALFAIFNDQNHRPNEGMGLEIHAMVYAYNTGGIEDSIIFMEYTVFNRTTQSYVDVYMSSWVDFDLGNSTDDLMGTNIEADAIFCYNSNSIDAGPLGFGNYLASCGLRVLKGPPADFFDGVDNDRDGCVDGVLINGICQSESPPNIREHYKMSGSMAYARSGSGGNSNTTDPSAPLQFYNYMKGLWKNGNPLVIESPDGFLGANNGDGYTPAATGTAVNYIYPGNSVDASGAFGPQAPVNWFASPNNNSDVRSLANMGPFRIQAGQSFKVDMAIVWSRDSSLTKSFTNINDRLDSLEGNFNNQPVRNVSLRDLSLRNAYSVLYNTRTQNWMIDNHSGRDLHFDIVTSTGQLLKTITAPSGSPTSVPAGSVSNGVYLLVNHEGGQVHKIMY